MPPGREMTRTDRTPRNRVVAEMGGAQKTAKFARFFVAPGEAHCAGGAGATPANALDAVVEWVERNNAPKELIGQRVDAVTGETMTRPVCRYPAVAMYQGHGDPDEAKSFSCTAHQSEGGGRH